MTHVVYKHFDADGQPLYVGVSRNVDARQYAHKDSDWWPLSAEMQVVECGNERIAKDYEHREIHRLRPRFNRQYNPDHGNWTPPSRPVADCPNEFDRAMHIMRTTPFVGWPAEYRADYCRIMQHNWKRAGLPGFDAPETDGQEQGE